MNPVKDGKLPIGDSDMKSLIEYFNKIQTSSLIQLQTAIASILQSRNGAIGGSLPSCVTQVLAATSSGFPIPAQAGATNVVTQTGYVSVNGKLIKKLAPKVRSLQYKQAENWLNNSTIALKGADTSLQTFESFLLSKKLASAYLKLVKLMESNLIPPPTVQSFRDWAGEHAKGISCLDTLLYTSNGNLGAYFASEDDFLSPSDKDDTVTSKVTIPSKMLMNSYHEKVRSFAQGLGQTASVHVKSGTFAAVVLDSTSVKATPREPSPKRALPEDLAGAGKPKPTKEAKKPMSFAHGTPGLKPQGGNNHISPKKGDSSRKNSITKGD